MDYLEQIYDPVEKAFWEGCDMHELLVRYCQQCEEFYWYPRPVCPFCGAQHTVFRRSGGTGVIYSLTRVHAKNAPVQTVAYITLDEGITLLSKIIDDEEGKARIGQRVAVTFLQPDKNGLSLPVFRLEQS